VATRLVPTTIKLSAKSGPEGRLFGSIGAAEIASAIVEQTGIDIDRKQLVMLEPIKELGTHTVPAKLHADVEFPVTIEVVTL
jgi:large subunit ribosomal protein L9